VVDYFALGGISSQSATAQGTRLETNGAASGGYSNHKPTSLPFAPQIIDPSFPSLNDADGYALSFQLQVLDESHVSNDRAGFSVIVLGDDGRGIELGFWEDRVFAQGDSPLFTHSEECLFDTVADEAEYVLSIQNSVYALSVDTQTILSGNLRDYSSFSGTPFVVPYSLTNYLFLGDNTTTASANVSIGSIVLKTTLTTIPEPSTWATLGIFLAAVGCRRRRYQ
jgi:hypothetical protein